ncbi:MAG: histidinol dehydrogenase, partial [Flavisolibacter sp.]|nr:histidinol dehydrogenase [Flavisolibacter sp.]
MKIVVAPAKETWPQLLQRPYTDNASVLATVQTIAQKIKAEGDTALYYFIKKLDGADLNTLKVSEEEIKKADREVSDSLKKAIQQAAKNITRFHEAQLGKVGTIETMPGIQCWRKNVGIEKVGLYIPGGTAPLFSSVLMLAIPAQLAGCKEIILCTP